jgi:PDDEXK-like domain of unknown function (DUF3799)
MSKEYIEKTRDSMTASKLKSVFLDPLYFKLKYIDELNAKEEEDEERHYIVGTAFHYLMEYGIDQFWEIYNISDRYLKKDIQELILKRFEEQWKEPDEIEIEKKRLNKTEMTLPRLREEWYWAKDWAKMCSKIEITGAEWRDLLWMWEEAVRQPMWDLQGTYSREQRLDAYYKDVRLSFQTDRIVFYSSQWEKADKRYTVEEMDAIMEWLTHDQRKEKAKELWLMCIIRDFKTTDSIDKMKKELMYDGETRFGYVFSMAFYYTLIYIRYGVESRVVIDVIEKTAPYVSDIIELPLSWLRKKLETTIIPTLDTYIKCKENNDRWKWPKRDDILSNKELKSYYRHFPSSVYTQATYIDLDM